MRSSRVLGVVLFLLSCSEAASLPELPTLAPLTARRERREALEVSGDGSAHGPGRAALSTESRRLLTATFPARLDERLRFSDSEGPAELFVSLSGATPSSARHGERDVIWPGAFPSTDVRAFASPHFAEVDYLLRGPDAPRHFTWKVELPRGGVWQVEPGGRLLLMLDGVASLAVPRPQAVDATGRELAVRFEHDADTLDFTLVDEPTAWPVVFDPIVEVPLWLKRFEPTPSPRTDHLFVYDERRGVSVLFGGRGLNGAVLADTWEFDGVRWTERSPATVPAARMGMAAVFDPVRRCVLMRGGNVFNGPVFSDTYTFDGVDWQRQQPAIEPPQFTGPRLAFDRVRGVAVLIGAESANTATYTWNDGGWTRQNPSLIPPALSFSGFAWDEQRQRCVLFGGKDGTTNPSNALYEWDGASWFRPMLAVNQLRMSHRLVFDPRAGELLSIMGLDGSNPTTESLLYNGARMLPVTLPMSARSGFDVAVHGAQRDLLLFGGSLGNAGVVNELWRGTDAGWSLVPSGTSSPGTRLSAAMAYDPSSATTVLTGGMPFPGAPVGRPVLRRHLGVERHGVDATLRHAAGPARDALDGLRHAHAERRRLRLVFRPAALEADDVGMGGRRYRSQRRCL